MRIEKALINDHLRVFQKYPENFAFHLFQIYSWKLQFSKKVAYLLTVSIVFSVYKENFTSQ